MYPKMHSDLKTALLKDKHGQEKLSWENRVRIALHTARALQYLHTGVKTERNIRFVFQNFVIILHLAMLDNTTQFNTIKESLPPPGGTYYSKDVEGLILFFNFLNQYYIFFFKYMQTHSKQESLMNVFLTNRQPKRRLCYILLQHTTITKVLF